jgi:hypothetical protein
MQQVWRTADGREFEDRIQAELHESVLGIRKNVIDWAKEKYGDKRGSATKAINVILDWEKDRDTALAA